MALELFPHNQTAYDTAAAMLAKTGKAAVIHPTGTGKSFIGFQLAADHPQKNVCWLSPSDHIIRTQLENLRDAGAFTPENVQFCTYAKLMFMTPSEIDDIRPDYIVLDEFHRCGAEVWGQGVQALLDRYPHVPILGLSATNIRYLDNQRDMADELFNGNIASQMTLGEAIVRGILKPPVYVTSAYIYQNEFDRLKSRVNRAKSQAVRDKADQYLDALRRALTQAEGLDQIFDRNMKDRTGKYIVFCSDREHMDELVEKVPAWFGKVDRAPHIYKVYADDRGSEQIFQDFREDSGGHLKLLFCIDMLNEGVHVDGVSGVILFRPTVSPIIYKQQIGRALSAKEQNTPIIFDIVNNFENLYSVGAIQEEMAAAVEYFQACGRSGEIVVERFRVIDEVRECRVLFTQLEQTLGASWEVMYQYAKRYYQRFGDLEVPRRYRTPEGYSIGHWIVAQRLVRRGNIPGNLSEDQIKRLDEIGMVWDNVHDLAWERNFAEAKAYFSVHGNLNVPAKLVTASGFRLGAWLSRLRSVRAGTMIGNLASERIQQLDALGMVWDAKEDPWPQNYQKAAEYYKENGNLNVSVNYVTSDGFHLGEWVNRMRGIRAGTVNGTMLTAEQIQLLDGIEMDWNCRSSSRWEQGYQAAKAYFVAHGDIRVPVDYICEDGFRLGRWLFRHRAGSIRVTPERRGKLDALGMVWEKPDSWQARYELSKQYYEAHGNLDMPAGYVADGIWLQKWLYEQRNIYQGKIPGKRLTQEQIEALDGISMDWVGKPKRPAWEERYQEVKRFREKHGHLRIPSTTREYRSMVQWLNRQREKRQAGKLSREQEEKLDALLMATRQ